MTEYFSFKYLSRFALFIAIVLLSALSELYAQSNIIYIYDDLGRLSRVVDQNNECATYEYDAVGNLLSITRSTNCLQPPTIASLSQDTANAGDTACITITGTNFLGATVTTDNPDVQISRVRVTETSIEVCLIISPFVSPGTTRIIVSTTAGVVERTITINGRTLLITQSTSIGRFDRSFDGTDLTIQGPATVTIDGPHRFRSLTLQNNAIVTHSATTNFSTSKLDLTVDTALTIDATSRIDVTGRGFLGAGQPGNPFVSSGMTVGFQSGSTGQSGGSYGGLGGGGSPNPVYGDFRNPNDAGSGGGRGSNPAGGNGGGLVRIVAQTLQLDGSILANGGAATFSNAGAGSGGGIRIDAGTLRGTGQITANGGSTGAGGGGGRIAVYYQDVTGFDLNKATAFGGSPNGGAGTIYLQGPGRESGELIVDNNNLVAATQSPPILAGPSNLLSLTNLRVRRGARVRTDDQVNLSGTLEISTGAEFIPAKRVIASSVDVNNSSVVTQFPTTATASFKVDLNANSLTIDATSRIDVTGRGFLGAGKPGNPFGDRGMTVGFQAGSTGQSGGSYGGLGGSFSGSSNPVYGDFRDPNDVGSGGATVGGNGGGLVRIVAQTIQLDGVIRADGEMPDRYAGGSGGGIRIDVGTLSGAGQITAKGGDKGPSGGSGGGGGRIAVYYQNATGFNLTNVTAFGGVGGNADIHGGAGTIYLQGPGRESGELIVDNNNLVAATQSTPILASPSNLPSLTNLRVRRAAKVRTDDQVNLAGTLEISAGAEFIPAKRVIASSVDVNNNSVVTQMPTTATLSFKVDLNANSLTIDATSRIDVTGRGFLGANKPGNPFGDRGMTVGFQAGSTGQSGGSYGGLGGSFSGSSNPVYGDFRDPNDVGSGGATVGGNGGGLVRIVAQTIQLDGVIRADGEMPDRYAGGSGGGIRIDVGTLSGAGQITAKGGDKGPSGGSGGGGGRIAVYYQNAAGFNLSRVTAFGGIGGNTSINGQDGTVHLEQTF